MKVDLRIGEVLQIGDAIVVLEHKSGRVARLVIHAPRSVQVVRAEDSVTSAPGPTKALSPVA